MTEKRIGIMKYIAAQCPKCGNVQAGQSKDPFQARFSCHKCGKQVMYYNKVTMKQTVKLFKVSNDPFEIQQYVAYIRLHPWLVEFKG